MTGISASGADAHNLSDVAAGEESPGNVRPLPGAPAVRRWIAALEHAQDVITGAAENLLDRVLLVLILVEIVHTVVLSLRAHRLVAQPFIVVGLIAVIRRILLVLTPGSGASLSTAELALLIAMVAVFVAGLIVVGRFEHADD